ncbi:hypothetical protein SeLEV6574_g02851 [Synchytrium endobioticum]|uniref:Uncharacterized protein n=1 Tax=Synchytrium endobioticum TaxID=286115 RepID=A0A507D6U4_9FUNG|nr:hypothetical protein SeLEV6574_g02851 [Synchytrium endobioticum]
MTVYAPMPTAHLWAGTWKHDSRRSSSVRKIWSCMGAGTLSKQKLAALSQDVTIELIGSGNHWKFIQNGSMGKREYLFTGTEFKQLNHSKSPVYTTCEWSDGRVWMRERHRNEKYIIDQAEEISADGSTRTVLTHVRGPVKEGLFVTYYTKA